jgi:hypothetical protein
LNCFPQRSVIYILHGRASDAAADRLTGDGFTSGCASLFLHHFPRRKGSMKLYVGNLAFGVTEDELAELFKPHGEVASAKIITDRVSGKSKGFGFVEMGSRGEGEQAIEALNGKMLQNRQIVVNEAKPQTAKPKGRGTGGGFGGGGRGGYGGGGGGGGGGFGGGGRGRGNDRDRW